MKRFIPKNWLTNDKTAQVEKTIRIPIKAFIICRSASPILSFLPPESINLIPPISNAKTKRIEETIRLSVTKAFIKPVTVMPCKGVNWPCGMRSSGS